jgi:hypothetical protein
MTAQLQTGSQPITTTELMPYEEPSKPRGRKRYFETGFYSMAGSDELMRAGREKSLPTCMRLEHFAQAKANIWGHSPFRKGELRELLKCSRPTVGHAIDTLVSGHAIAPASTESCIVLNCKRYRRADRSYKRCMEPSHDGVVERMWNPDTGWEKRHREWQDHLDGIRILRTTETTEKIERTQRKTELIEIPVPAVVRPDWWQGCPSVNGHQELPGGGHEFCPVAVIRCAR